MNSRKKIKLFEIFYSENIKKSLDDGFDLFDARDVNDPHYREIPIFRKFCMNSTWEHSEYSGLFSPKFTQKSGLDSNKIIDFINSKPEADIYLFHPFKHELTISANFMQLAELEHPGITAELRILWKKIFGRSLPFVDSNVDYKLCCHCNYFVANHIFWKEYSKFVLDFSQNYLTSIKTQYTLTRDRDLFLPMSVFCFERALTHYLKDHPEIIVENYSTNPDWKQVELFEGEAKFCRDLLSVILSETSENRLEKFDLAIKAYYFYRRIMIRENIAEH